MIKSMTGFGRCESADQNSKVTVELKSVNHRFLDLNIRMPKKFNLLEAAIRRTVKRYVSRGKVDLYIGCEDLAETETTLQYNRALAGEYVDYYRQMAADFALENDLRVSALARSPEVLTMAEQSLDEEEMWKLLEQTLHGALKQFNVSREQEGANLQQDLLGKLEFMQENIDRINERAPEIVKAYREKLTAKVQELLGDNQLDESRILQEVVVYSEKICTDEETVRLASHVGQMRQTLTAGSDGSGKKLDFLAQEMNREANTILSKANDLAASNYAIDLKTEIEKIREQIQNIE